MLIGTLLSPYIFGAIKYYGCYSLAISLNMLVTVYFLLMVKEMATVLITLQIRTKLLKGIIKMTNHVALEKSTMKTDMF